MLSSHPGPGPAAPELRNPRNPYPYEIEYDQHVWMPSANAKYVSLRDFPEDHDGLSSVIRRFFPEVVLVEHTREHKLLLQKALLSRLSESEISQLREKCRELAIDDYPRNLLRIGTHLFPEVRDRLGTTAANPPDDVHRMQKGDPFYIGDIYSANMVLSSLDALNIDLEDGKSYLDFGCSSGSLLRMLTAYRPAAHFHGADPIAKAIEWAQANVSRAKFYLSNTQPPLPLPQDFLDGATAISIWSHLGEQEALSWFEELHRCLKPGGWLCFTTHGLISSYHYCTKRIQHPRRVKAVVEGLINNDFVFEEVYIDASPEGINATGYGNTYFRREWVLRNLSDKWKLLSYEPGANQSNQDIYTMQKI